MTLTKSLARAAIRWLTRLAEDPPDPEEDTLGNASRDELQAEAIARQARHPYRPMAIPKPPTPEEVDSHLRYVQPKPKPKPTRKRVK